MLNNAEITNCPCGTGQAYADCCQLIHASGAGLGCTAEQLMRSRYSAYVLENEAFLLQSWHEDHRPKRVEFSADVTWVDLTVVHTDAGSGLDQQGTVEFKARFMRGDEHLELHELSSFARVDGSWVYVDGDAP